MFTKTALSFLYAGLLEKPCQLVLFREIEQGGLGLMCIQTRATAALITTFLQTAINPNFTRNYYHNDFRRYVLDEDITALIIPPSFKGDFFPNIRRLKDSSPNIEIIPLKGVYDFLMSETLREETHEHINDPMDIDSNPINWPLRTIKCEIENPTTDWPKQPAVNFHRHQRHQTSPKLLVQTTST